MPALAKTPVPPYYAVVFTSVRTDLDPKGYEAMAVRMVELASKQEGFLGLESARDADGVGITVSYWQSPEAIRAWRENTEHRIAQEQGKGRWYDSFQLRICRVEADYGFVRTAQEQAGP